jgi:hypothetical protein
MDTKLKYSTAFHPQIDGQTEVINRMLVQLLRGYNSRHPNIWDEKIVYIQHYYNRALHSLPISLLSRRVLVIYLLHHLIFCMDGRRRKKKCKEKNRRKAHSWTRSGIYI